VIVKFFKFVISLHMV